MVKLSAANLNALPANVGRPAYRASDISPGIVHFGLGNFHRAHLAVYLDQLFNAGKDRDWGVIGAGVFEGEKAIWQKLREQDWLTTVVEQDTGRVGAHVTGAMVDFIEPANGPAIVEALADPRIRIVSMTITEGGYFIDPATQKFSATNPAIAADGAAPGSPKTVFGLILAGLKRRRDAGLKPFTVMSCDNIPHNGVVTRNAVVGLARLSDPAFADWVEANVAFPNAMVDRIAVVTTDRERQILKDEFGVEDNWPVFCEEFKQWVIEDNFTAGRPAFETVGVQFVHDVTPFEMMKIRILNGGHATIAYPAGLLDIHFVHEAMQNELVSGFLSALHVREIVPTVGPVPGTSLNDYKELIARRFANPRIGDTIRRLAHDGANRQPKFIVPVVADRLEAGASIDGLALESAMWCRYCFGTTDSGAEIAPNDPIWDRLKQTAAAAKTDPDAWLAMSDIYGEVGRSPKFQAAFARSLKAIWADGVAETLRRYIAG